MQHGLSIYNSCSPHRPLAPHPCCSFACTTITQVIACVASNQYGGQSVEMSHLGKYLRLTYEKYLRRTRFG